MLLFGCFVVVSFVTMVAESHYHVEIEKKCNCLCGETFMESSYTNKPVCHVLSRFEKELVTFKDELARRIAFINQIAELKEIMEEQNDLLKTLQDEINDMKKSKGESEILPTPASLIMNPEDSMLEDSSRETRMKEEKELANNVSTLIKKVAMVENLTSEVQEELKSERRVRRHLEEDLNETRFSIKLLDDKLQNVTFPMDSRVTQVEEIVLSTLENMNKTLFEEHLKALYYKVNGVVYKNETQKLDERLEHVETELIDVSNTSVSLKLAEEIRNLSTTLSTLNQTVVEKLATEESRLEDLENSINKLNEFERIDDQMTLLFNASELIQSGVSELWSDIQNIRNVTVHLEKELSDQEIKRNNTVKMLKLELFNELNDLTEDMIIVKNDIRTGKESFDFLQRDVQMLAADVAISENKVKELTISSENKIKDMYSKIDNLTDVWDSSLTALSVQIVEWKNSEKHSITQNTEEMDYSTDNPITDSLHDFSLSTDGFTDIDYTEEDQSTRMRIINAECTLPQVNDTHLLITLSDDNQGTQTLSFACVPIGKYGLTETSSPMQCVNGIWRGAFPTCSRLLNENEVSDISRELKMRNPCSVALGDVPDPTDCTRFFKCWHGRSQRMKCPTDLHFSPSQKLCDYPFKAKCIPYFPPEMEILKDLVPTILIEPDNVDKPFGLMGTGDKGHLIVYPRTSFQLHCLFPESLWGPPSWFAEHFSTGFSTKVPYQTSGNRATIQIATATTDYSGIYSCHTPFGKQHSITIMVEAVTCPAFPEYSESVKYNRHPDGGERILSTTAEFQCEGNFAIKTTCLANSTWSRPPPTVDECPPKKVKPPTLWGCPLINTENQPDLLLEKDDDSFMITFRCSGHKRLVGPSFTTCYQGSWSHDYLPRCIPFNF